MADKSDKAANEGKKSGAEETAQPGETAPEDVPVQPAAGGAAQDGATAPTDGAAAQDGATAQDDGAAAGSLDNAAQQPQQQQQQPFEIPVMTMKTISDYGVNFEESEDKKMRANLFYQVPADTAQIDRRLRDRLAHEAASFFSWVDSIFLPPLKDQKQAGSCWNFAGSLVEETNFLIRKDAKESLVLSTNYMKCTDLFTKLAEQMDAAVLLLSRGRELQDEEVEAVWTTVSQGGGYQRYRALAETFGVLPAFMFEETPVSEKPAKLVKMATEEMKDLVSSLYSEYSDKPFDGKTVLTRLSEMKNELFDYISHLFGGCPRTHGQIEWRSTKRRDGSEILISGATPLEFWESMKSGAEEEFVVIKNNAAQRLGSGECRRAPRAESPFRGAPAVDYPAVYVDSNRFVSLLAAEAERGAVFCGVQWNWTKEAGRVLHPEVIGNRAIPQWKARVGVDSVSKVLTKQRSPSHAVVAYCTKYFSEQEVTAGLAGKGAELAADKSKVVKYIGIANSYGDEYYALHPEFAKEYFMEAVIKMDLLSEVERKEAKREGKKGESSKSNDDNNSNNAIDCRGCGSRNQ